MVDVIAVVPRTALCEPSAYPVDIPPANCKLLAASHAIGAGGKHVLLVADDKSGLDQAIRRGVADAVCAFQPMYYDNLDPKKADAICAVAAKLTAPK